MNYFHKSVRTEQELEKRQFKLNINENIIQKSEWLIVGLRIFCEITIFRIIKRHDKTLGRFLTALRVVWESL